MRNIGKSYITTYAKYANGIWLSNEPLSKESGTPKKAIFNGDTTILIWEDGNKTIIKKAEDEEYNKRIAFLTAYFYKKSGLSKNKAKKYLDDILGEELKIGDQVKINQVEIPQKYKIGDKVKVVNNSSCHGFDIGQIVEVRSLHNNGNIETCKSGNKYWFLSDGDVRKVEN